MSLCVLISQLRLGIYDAVAHFNIGCHASVKIFEKLGISPEQHCLTGSQRTDALRMFKGNYKAQEGNREKEETASRVTRMYLVHFICIQTETNTGHCLPWI